MVPVIDRNNRPLFPCKERRATALLCRGEAVAFFQAGIFCIKLVRQETEKREEYPIVALGIDTGSKREGYTVATAKTVILNVTTNTPDWVREHLEIRRILRRSRRQRKTPYRKMRENRATLRKSNRIPPSTRARWNAKLRIIKQLQRILPITHINVEDIKAKTKPGKPKWNLSFSPLEVGKAWFYSEVRKLNLILSLTEGTETKAHRDNRGFKKTKKKLDYVWEAHNSDSHSLAEMALGVAVEPFKGLYQIEFLEYSRRQLQVQQPAKGGIRKPYGTTISMGLPRGATVQYREKLGYIGGSSNNRISIHNIDTGKRITQLAKKEEIKMLYVRRFTTRFLKEQTVATGLQFLPLQDKTLEGVSLEKKQ